MRVTLDVFSGRPNPSWTLTENDLSQLVDRTAGKTHPPAGVGGGGLGYRGFIVSVTGDASTAAAKLPPTFRIGGQIPQSTGVSVGAESALFTPQESDQTALWLLTTAPQGAVPDEVLGHAESVIKQRASGTLTQSQQLQQPQQPQTPVQTSALATQCALANISYNPDFWNVPEVQPHNNCYNFATDYRSDSFSQPGRISGHLYDACQCPNVTTAAEYDGCVQSCSAGITYYLVALVMWPGQDFHWYRYQPLEGFWAHKPGQDVVRNVDGSQRVISTANGLNPSNCNRGPYTVFCEYLVVPVGMQVE